MHAPRRPASPAAVDPRAARRVVRRTGLVRRTDVVRVAHDHARPSRGARGSVGPVSGLRRAGTVPGRCSAVLHGHRCQQRTGHPGVHLVEDGPVRLRWRDGTPPDDDWLLDAFDS